MASTHLRGDAAAILKDLRIKPAKEEVAKKEVARLWEYLLDDTAPVLGAVAKAIDLVLANRELDETHLETLAEPVCLMYRFLIRQRRDAG